jgi:hypothetical protein
MHATNDREFCGNHSLTDRRALFLSRTSHALNTNESSRPDSRCAATTSNSTGCSQI